MKQKAKLKKVECILREIEAMVIDHIQDDTENTLSPYQLISSALEMHEVYSEEE